MGQTYGVTYRESRPATWTQCRVRGGAVVRGELVMLDLAGAESSSTAPQGAVGTRTAEGSPLATVLTATSGLQVGRVGVMSAAAGDDAIGYVELGDTGDGDCTPIIVEALVAVSAAAVEGAALQVSTATLSDALGGVTAVLVAGGGSGATYAVLLQDATADDGAGPSSAVNYKRVLMYSEGKTAADPTEPGGIIVGQYYALTSQPSAFAFSSTAKVSQATTLYPWTATRTWTPAEIGVYVVTGAVSSACKVLVYAHDAATGWPGAKVYESASLPTETSTTYAADTTTRPSFVAGRIYWLGILASGTPSLRSQTTVYDNILGHMATVGTTTPSGILTRTGETYATPTDPWGFAASQLGAGNVPVVIARG